MLEDDPYVAPGFNNYIYILPLDSDEKETKVYTLGILSIFPLFFAMYEDLYKRNPNIWEQNDKELDHFMVSGENA